MKKIGIIFLLILISACIRKTGVDKNISTFWKQLQEKEVFYFNLNINDSAGWSELYTLLQEDHPGLGFIIGSEIIDGKKDFIITANGNNELFEEVEVFVKKAPRLNLLKPIALIPRMTRIQPFVIGDTSLTAEEVRVHFDEPVEGKYDLIFILPPAHTARIINDETGQNYDTYLQLLYLMTIQALGEKLMIDKISGGSIFEVNVVMPSIPLMDLYDTVK